MFKRRGKYNAKPVKSGGRKFDSTLEYKRFGELTLLQKAGKITHLEHHRVFSLNVNNHPICKYEADFTYFDSDKNFIVEDVKSKATITPLFRLKAKLMKACHGIDILITGLK